MAGRVCIPLHNLNGRLIGYSGRKIKETKTDSPKYKFPKGFEKDFLLYNYHRAKDYCQDCLILVEGFFSVFHLWQAGFMNVMALAGTSMNNYQFDVIVNRLKPEKIVTLFDGDEAGYGCREKVQERFEHIIQIRSFKLREGKQPTDFTKEQLEQVFG